MPRELLVPGSFEFEPATATRPVDLSDVRKLVGLCSAANWRHPEAPGSTLHWRERHPVTHVAYEDVDRYPRWSGKTPPTEAEWEYARLRVAQ